MTHGSPTRPVRTSARRRPPLANDGTAQSYDWRVEAYQDNTLLSTGAVGTYTIAPATTITNLKVGLTGNAITGADGTALDTCGSTLPSECQNLRQTPVLKWDPSPGYSLYRVYETFDGAVNPVSGHFPINVRRDHVVGHHRPCPTARPARRTTGPLCRACPPLLRSGRPRLARLQQAEQPGRADQPGVGARPADPTEVADDITFTWQDYLASEADADTSEHLALLTSGDRGTAVPDPGLDDVRLQHAASTTSWSTRRRTPRRLHLPRGCPLLAGPGRRRLGQRRELERHRSLREALPDAGPDLPDARSRDARPDARGER